MVHIMKTFSHPSLEALEE